MKKRHRMLVYTGFQVKYIIAVVALAVVTLGTLGYLYSSVLAEQRTLLGLNQVATGLVHAADKEAVFEKEMQAKFRSSDHRKVVILIVVSALLVFLLALVALRITHRIAGPVYVVSNTLKAMAMGRLDPVRSFRRKDEFLFLTEDLRALRETLLEREQKTRDTIDNVIEVLNSIELARKQDRDVVKELKTELEDFVAHARTGDENG